jgi:hypothetical protein
MGICATAAKKVDIRVGCKLGSGKVDAALQYKMFALPYLAKRL